MNAPAGNPEQRTAADPALSVWVSANAGSGKTKVLVDRVMRLMLAGTPPDRILALTYTRSAAAEMANRLSEVLGSWAIGDAATLDGALIGLLDRPPTDGERRDARRLFTRALDTPGGLRIRTIHGFCQSLLARFPVEAGIAPHFRLIEGSEQADLLKEATDEVLAGLAAHEDAAVRGVLDKLMAEVEETRFAPLIADLLHGRARGRLSDAMAATLGRIRARLGVGGNDTRESILAEACADGACNEAALRRALAALAKGTAKDAERGSKIGAWWQANPRVGRFESDYLPIFTKKDGAVFAKLTTKAVDKADPQAADTLAAEAERILAVKARLAAVDLAELSGLITGLSRELLAAYGTRKRQHAVLDYDDLIDRTVGLLGKPGIAPWVLWKLDGGIDHILVDEAQDTAPDQWRIVAALAEEFFTPGTARAETRTIFAVGDEKQSIYGFQGAAPAEFGRFKTHFATAAEAARKPFQAIDLGLSFRSAPAILAAVDTVFATPAMQAAVTAGGHWVEHRAHRKDAHGLVEIWPTVTPEDGEAEPEAWDAPLDRLGADEPQARLAQRIAGQVKGWTLGGTRPEDILVLVRRRNAFVDELVRRFKALGVPVAGADRMQLLEQIAVKDLLAAIGTAILPEDDLTLACVLRSPLIGLGESDLFDLAHDRGASRLWRRLAERRAEPRFAAAHARIAGWLAAADRLPPFEFLSRILEAEGGRKALAARLGPESGDPIDELLALALSYERASPPSLQGFHHWIGTHDAEVKRDLEQGGGAVRIMTVHGAKGLEAPIVILPDTCAAPDFRNDPKILWLLPDPPAPVWVPVKEMHTPETLAARDAWRAAQSDEYLRLLYVAMTRARDRLYVTGWETKRGRAEGCWYDRLESALRPVATEVEVAGLGTVLRFETGTPAAPARRETLPPAPPLPGWALSPPPPEPAPPRPLAPSRPAEEEPAVLAPLLDQGRRFRRGLLIHRLLQTLPDLAPMDRPAAGARFLSLAAADLEPAARDALLTEALELFALPEAAMLFGPGSRAEVPITGRVGDAVVSGQVDRLAVTAEAVYVVDYKTNRPPPAEITGVSPAYLRQMALYRGVLAQIFPDRAIRAALLWTDGPRFMEIPVELLDNRSP